jgi:hypothetical protein
MKNASFFVLALLALPLQPAYAGALFGTLRVDNAPAQGYSVFLQCPGTQLATATTDPRGGFTLRAQAVGSCSMWVQHGNVVGGRFSVFVSDQPMRFDVAVDGSLNRH